MKKNETVGFNPELRADNYAMIEGHCIIYFGPEDWEGMWRNRHQLMSRFAQKNKVMYVEPVFSVHKLKKQLKKGIPGLVELWSKFCRGRVTKNSHQLFIYHSPVFMPIFGRSPLDKFSWWIWNKFFRSDLKSLGFSKPIIWLSRPTMSCFVGNFDEKLIVYHVVDEYLSYGEMDVENRKRLEKQEKKLLNQADLVVVVSEKLYQTKSVFNSNTYLIPNGVDYYAYDKALRSDTPLPLDIASLPKPIIGYSGLISRRLDLELLEKIAKQLPDCSFVLIGQINETGCESKLKRLKVRKNIHMLGAKQIEQVPFYVKAFDICIIPYKLNEQTENLSPLKLYDFMAMGKEIITTDVPVARQFKDVVHIAYSPGMFLDYINESLIDADQEVCLKRRRVAAQNTWEDRVEKLSDIILSHL